MGLSIVEMIIILAILLLNLVTIVCLKNKIAVVSAVMISNLMIILLYVKIISDYHNLQELILSTIIYSAAILVLIFNTSHINQANSKHQKSQNFNKNSYGLLFILTIALSFGGFYLIDNIKNQPQITKQINNNVANQHLELNNIKIETRGNVLFKRSTDAVLIIVGAMLVLLLGSKYHNRESNI